jgi:hypothetical protein
MGMTDSGISGKPEQVPIFGFAELLMGKKVAAGDRVVGALCSELSRRRRSLRGCAAVLQQFRLSEKIFKCLIQKNLRAAGWCKTAKSAGQKPLG